MHTNLTSCQSKHFGRGKIKNIIGFISIARYNRSSAASHPASETTRLYQSEQATVARRQPARQQPNVARRQQEVDTSDGEQHFDMGRFVLCWTGLSTQASKLTCKRDWCHMF